MASIIRVLDELTINKIAAGEVIENPSSVVKELIDNALDANSSEICVDIRQGGRTLIRVHDNGVGMTKDDAILSLERHATSKIQSVDELFVIDTMGFRGEAIPSIASVSRFSIHTSKDGRATHLEVEGGKLLIVEERMKTQGTLVEVRDLFFNVPVRKKFQRAPSYDASEVIKIVTRLSLANPHISFELTSDGKVVFKSGAAKEEDPTEMFKARIVDVLGESFLEDSYPIKLKLKEIELSGFLGAPLASKPNRLSQHLFINRRPVFSPFIAECVKESYGSSLPQGKFPIFALHLTAPKDLIDINVHPQKKEVRLRHFDLFKEAIKKGVRDALFGESGPQISEAFSFAVHANPLERSVSPFPLSRFERQDPDFPPDEPESVPFPSFQIRNEPAKEEEPTLFKESKTFAPSFNVLFSSSDIAIVQGSFGQEERPALFTLIDLKAAKEAVFVGSIKGNRPSAVDMLLVPHIFELKPGEAALLKERLSELNALGILIRQFGDASFCLDGLPSLFGDIEIEAFTQDLVETIKTFPDSSLKEKIGTEIVRAALKTGPLGKNPSHKEVSALIEELIRLGRPRVSPSGKPISAPFDSSLARKAIAKISEW